MKEEEMKNGRKCPICGKEPDEKYKPFCSKKCADVDLGRWLKGTYVIRSDEKPDEEDILTEKDIEK